VVKFKFSEALQHTLHTEQEGINIKKVPVQILYYQAAIYTVPTVHTYEYIILFGNTCASPTPHTLAARVLALLYTL